MTIFFIGARLCLVTLLCYCSALAVNRFIALRVAPPVTVPDQVEQPSPAVAQPKPLLSSYAVISNRDLFNSVRAPVQNDSAPGTGNSYGLRLWGTAVRDHHRAFAIIEDQGKRVQGLYREGEVIAPGITLLRVGWNRVTIERNGQRDVLIIPTDAPLLPVQPLTLSLPMPNEERGGIRQVTPEIFQVDRRAVDDALANLSDLLTQARALPQATSEGTMQGFRVFAIKPQSFIDRLGLKDGDIIQSINGVEMTDPGTAFSFMQDLPGLSQLRVDVLRNHQPMTLSYDIR